MRRMPDSLEQAACLGLPAAIFDARMVDDANAALSVCSYCFVRRECEQWVRPKQSYYSGVCAGKIWREGKDVTDARLNLLRP